MGRIKEIIGRQFDSWDEICTNEQARLRTNNILAYVAITLTTLVMVAINAAVGITTLMSLAAGLCAIFFTMLLTILVWRQMQGVCVALTYLCAIALSVYLLYSGGSQGFSPIWLCVMPSVSYLISGRRLANIFNTFLVCIVVVALWTPARDLLAFQYTAAFINRFPFIVLFAVLCAWISEMVRVQTQIRLADTRRTLEECALTDALTGIGNRHAFHQDLLKIPNAGSLCYAVVDLDFFKRVNDAYGHTMGDEVLKMVAHSIRNGLRPLDRLYRWGGEEFLIVLPRLEYDDFEKSMRRLCKKIESVEFRLSGGIGIKLTISIGGVVGAPELTPEECVGEADKNLYLAKQTGRNRAVVTDHSPVCV